jgi:hypothetical protein
MVWLVVVLGVVGAVLPSVGVVRIYRRELANERGRQEYVRVDGAR